MTQILIEFGRPRLSVVIGQRLVSFGQQEYFSFYSSFVLYVGFIVLLCLLVVAF